MNVNRTDLNTSDDMSDVLQICVYEHQINNLTLNNDNPAEEHQMHSTALE